MPAVFRHQGFRYGFYSNEGEPREPPHVHVSKGDADAKFWLLPRIELAYNRGHPPPVLRDLADIVTARRKLLLEAWNDFFSEGG